MADDVQVSDAKLVVNNDHWGVVSDTIKFDEGLGEQKVLIVSDGAGQVHVVHADDPTTKIGMVEFELRCTLEDMRRARKAKLKGGKNAVQLQLIGGDGTRNINWAQMAITAPLEHEIGPEKTIKVSFHGGQAT